MSNCQCLHQDLRLLKKMLKMSSSKTHTPKQQLTSGLIMDIYVKFRAVRVANVEVFGKIWFITELNTGTLWSFDLQVTFLA